MHESEVDETSQIDHRDAKGESELDLFDAAESDSAAVTLHEPRNRTFEHQAILSIVRNEVPLAPGATRLDEFGVVSGEVKSSPALGVGAAWSKRAVRAVLCE